MSSINYNMKVPSFKGTDSEDVLMWFSSFQSVMSFNGINERNPLIFYYFRLALSDAALHWICEYMNKYEENRQVLISMACNNLGLLSSCLLPVEELSRIEEQAKPLILKDFGKLKETFIKRFAPKICSSIAELSLINNQENQCNSIKGLNEIQRNGNSSSNTISSNQSVAKENYSTDLESITVSAGEKSEVTFVLATSTVQMPILAVTENTSLPSFKAASTSLNVIDERSSHLPIYSLLIWSDATLRCLMHTNKYGEYHNDYNYQLVFMKIIIMINKLNAPLTFV